MKEAHAALLAAKPAEAPTTPADVAAIMEEQRAVDAQHDHALRALFYLLLAASEHALSLDPPDEASANAYQAASARLFPRGVDGTRATYLAEEGDAKLAAQVREGRRRPRGDARRARAVEAEEGERTALFKAYVDLGLAIGDLERKKIARGRRGEHDAGDAGDRAQRLDRSRRHGRARPHACEGRRGEDLAPRRGRAGREGAEGGRSGGEEGQGQGRTAAGEHRHAGHSRRRAPRPPPRGPRAALRLDRERRRAVDQDG